MNYGELQTAVAEDTHRPDLSGLIPRFIREGEGMIRREMTAYLFTGTLQETDRVSAGSPIYTLPDGILIIRRVALQGQRASDVTRMALGSIGGYSVTDRVHSYAEDGTGTIEFRGTPAENTIFDLNYFGMPAELSQGLDTNDLLNDHEVLYIAAASFYVYQHTQDLELAQTALSSFTNVVETLNEQVARKIGGAKITQSYNMAGGSSY